MNMKYKKNHIIKLTPPSSNCILSTLNAAGFDTVTKYARGPNEFMSDQ